VAGVAIAGLIAGCAAWFEPKPTTPVVDLTANVPHELTVEQAADAALRQVARQARDLPDEVGEVVAPQVLKVTLLRPNEHYKAQDVEFFQPEVMWAVDWQGTVYDCSLSRDCAVFDGGTFMVQDSSGDILDSSFQQRRDGGGGI
jgi:hypothetical protein